MSLSFGFTTGINKKVIAYVERNILGIRANGKSSIGHQKSDGTLLTVRSTCISARPLGSDMNLFSL